jgi:hypothetical protein
VRLARSELFAPALPPGTSPPPKHLDLLLEVLEAPPVEECARARLARSLDRHGEAQVKPPRKGLHPQTGRVTAAAGSLPGGFLCLFPTNS